MRPSLIFFVTTVITALGVYLWIYALLDIGELATSRTMIDYKIMECQKIGGVPEFHDDGVHCRKKD